MAYPCHAVFDCVLQLSEGGRFVADSRIFLSWPSETGVVIHYENYSKLSTGEDCIKHIA